MKMFLALIMLAVSPALNSYWKNGSFLGPISGADYLWWAVATMAVVIAYVAGHEAGLGNPLPSRFYGKLGGQWRADKVVGNPGEDHICLVYVGPGKTKMFVEYPPLPQKPKED